jgi:hypothetical protein
MPISYGGSSGSLRNNAEVNAWISYMSLTGGGQSELLEELETIEVDVINDDQAVFNPPELGSREIDGVLPFGGTSPPGVARGAAKVPVARHSKASVRSDSTVMPRISWCISGNARKCSEIHSRMAFPPVNAPIGVRMSADGLIIATAVSKSIVLSAVKSRSACLSNDI